MSERLCWVVIVVGMVVTHALVSSTTSSNTRAINERNISQQIVVVGSFWMFPLLAGRNAHQEEESVTCQPLGCMYTADHVRH